MGNYVSDGRETDTYTIIRQTERQTDKSTDRLADRLTGRQTDRKANRQADRSTDRQTNSWCVLLQPGIGRRNHYNATRDYHGTEPDKECNGVGESADEVTSQHASKLAQLWQITAVSHHERHPSTILQKSQQQCHLFHTKNITYSN